MVLIPAKMSLKTEIGWCWYLMRSEIIALTPFLSSIMCFFFICYHAVSGCRSALGIEDGAISDQQITASSAASSAYAYRGRLNSQNTESQSGAWSASVTDENQWLQIDLGGSYYTMVTRVATQGRNGLPEWVTKYKLQHSYNGVELKNYKEKGKFTDEVRHVNFSESESNMPAKETPIY